MSGVKCGRVVQAGDLIGIIALSSSCERERFQRGVRNLEKLGFRAKIALEPCENYGKNTHLFSSDAPGARARALTELFLDKEVAAVISARGAHGSMEILPLLDYRVFKDNPKPLVGFSDVTAVLVACYQKAELATLHGPTIESAFSKADNNEHARLSVSSLISYLKGEIINPFEQLDLQQICGRGEGHGPIIGGNLSMLSSLMGTPFEPNFADHILFLEEVGEKPYRVHRMLLQMKLAGKFKNLAGVLLGDFRSCEHDNGPTVIDVMRNIFAEGGFPVAAGVPAGHGPLNQVMPLGVEAALVGGKLEISQSAVLH